MEDIQNKTNKNLTNEHKLFIEQGFFSTGTPPNLNDFQKYFNLTKEQTLNLAIEFNTYKANNNLDVQINNLLTPEQFQLAQLLLNPTDRRSTRVKLKECGVTMATYNKWRHNPVFMNYFRTSVRNRFKDADVTADLELVKLLEDGDLKAITYYNEMTGRHTQSDQVNLARVMAMIMETLVQFVTPDVLRQIAAQLEDRMKGVIETTSSDTSLPEHNGSSMPQLTFRRDNG